MDNYTKINYTPPDSYFVAKFDEDGRMEEFILCDDMLTNEKKQALIDKGWIEISETDWKYYRGYKGDGNNNNGYILGQDNKPVSAPPVSRKEKANTITEEYTARISELKDAIVTAILIHDDDLVSELREEYLSLMQEYQTALAEVE